MFLLSDPTFQFLGGATIIMSIINKLIFGTWFPDDIQVMPKKEEKTWDGLPVDETDFIERFCRGEQISGNEFSEWAVKYHNVRTKEEALEICYMLKELKESEEGVDVSC